MPKQHWRNIMVRGAANLMWATVVLGAVPAASQSDLPDLEELLFLDTYAFLETVKSPGPATDIDSLMRLPTQQARAAIQVARDRPLRTEVEFIPIKTDGKSFDWNYLTTLINGEYIDGLNIIKLYAPYSDGTSEPDDNQHFIIFGMGQETKFAFLHEKRHAQKIELAGLGFDQLVQYVLHDEIAARVVEILGRRSVFLDTFNKPGGDAAVYQHTGNGVSYATLSAFPRATFFKQQDGYFTESGEYIDWLNRNGKSLDINKISTNEADVILRTILKNVNREFMLYIREGQFENMIRVIMHRNFLTQSKFLRAPESSALLGMDDVLRKKYDTRFGSFLDLISPDMQHGFSNVLRAILRNDELVKQVQNQRDEFDSKLAMVSDMARQRAGTDSPQKHDVNAPGPQNLGIKKRQSQR
ncbi:MAG: hypothetical protein LBR41_01770 [Rickettsiales bacterium]|jgi:hypothetical protein|nr:hypothetical protein [Rickettsiales bacterium]